MNKQREVIYDQRRDGLDAENAEELIKEMQQDVLEDSFEVCIPVDAYADDWDLEGLNEAVSQQYGVQLDLTAEAVDSFSRDGLLEHVSATLNNIYQDKVQLLGRKQFQGFERWVLLQVIDKHWKDHLLAMDHLKEGIGLRGYAQKNPLNEYKREGFDLFVAMADRIKSDVVEHLFKARISHEEEELVRQPQPRRSQRMVAHRGGLPSAPGAQANDGGTVAVQTVRRQGEKIGRNAPCPCGSGKKYKRCCGA